MDNLCLVLIVLAYFAGAMMHFVLSSYLIPYRHLTYVWLYALRNHKKYGIPCQTDLVLDRRGYSLGYSFERRCALWVSYVISRGSIGVDVERGENFDADPDIPENYRVKPEDYTNSGYDKGHLAPSAAIDFSRKSNNETFLMSNIALQDPKLNRQAWSKLEGLSRKWTHTKGNLYIITGPLYGQRPRKINNIPVPKYFYKVIYSIHHKKAIGFIMPNQPVSNASLWDYALPVKQIEEQSGYRFLSKLSKKGTKIKVQIDLDWWKND